MVFHLQGNGQCVIQGGVLDSETKSPLLGAAILLKSSERGTVTDPWGKFILDGIKPGAYVLEIKHMGYFAHTHKITLQQGDTTHLEILLKPEIKTLEGIEVRGLYDDPSSMKVPYVRSTVHQNQIIQSSVTDIGTYIRSVPNVSGIRKGGSTVDPVIRGFKYSQLNVQVDDGQKIEGGCPNRMDPAASHIDLEDLRSLEILKGPYAFRYGPSFGGIINLRTHKPGFSERFSIDGSALIGYTSNPSGAREHLILNGANRLVNFSLSGNNKQNGDYVDGNGNRVKAESKKYNVKGQFGITPGKQHKLLFSYLYSMGQDVAFPALPMDMREDKTKLMSLDYTWDHPSELALPVKVKLYRSDVKHTMDNKDRPNSDTVVAVTIVQAFNTGGRLEGGFNNGNYNLLMGVDFEHITKDGDRVKTLIMQPTMPSHTEQIWNNAVIANLGFFAEFRKSLTPFDVIASARLDLNQANSDDITFEKMGTVIYFNDNNESKYVNFSASGGFECWINPTLSLSLTLGRGIRSPDMTERFITLLPVGYDNYDYLGNPSLKPEANNQVDLTARFKDPNIGNFEVNGFYSLVTDYITGKIVPPVEQKPATSGVIGVKKFYNADRARFRGFELTYASTPSSEWYIHFIAAYTRATINEAVRHIISDQGEVSGTETINNDPLSEIPPFESTLVIGYKFLQGRLLPKIKGRIAAHQNHVSKAFYEQTTPGFFVAGFSCSYYHNAHFTITGGVDNIFDKAYYEHLSRRIIGNTYDLYEPGRNFYVNLIFSI
ncbi:MAG TPA: TonB-dependent receptor [Bacteroidales bacterium]|nr:TonB-dependent receptor [Bacteroidales bacterium]